MEPIFFQGKPYTARKRYFDGTHRILSPEETWEKILPLASRMGLARVANITGLDRIGIPVTLAIRPASMTLSTSSGKGLSLITAQVSGFMEALELHCAENARLSFLQMSYEQLAQETAVIPLSLLPCKKKSLFHPKHSEKWTKGWDILNQKEVAVPLVSVVLNYQINRHEPKDLLSFDRSSNGLASGNHFLEAVSSGIYELIERDAITCHLFTSDTIPYRIPRVRLETITYPSVLRLLDQLKKSGFQAFLYDCSVDTEVPVFMASIYDTLFYKKGIGMGYGAHLDPEVAMIRSLTEAIQGRVVTIAGSRDDMFSLHAPSKQTDISLLVKALESSPALIDASIYSSQATLTLEGDIHLLLKKLKNIRIEQIVAFDLSEEESPVATVRILIPGLEGHYSGRKGKRAQEFCALKLYESQMASGNFEQFLNIFGSQVHSPAGGTL